jgi:hypothetical protein
MKEEKQMWMLEIGDRLLIKLKKTNRKVAEGKFVGFGYAGSDFEGHHLQFSDLLIQHDDLTEHIYLVDLFFFFYIPPKS